MEIWGVWKAALEEHAEENETKGKERINSS